MENQILRSTKNIENKIQRDYILKTAIDCQTRALELDDMFRNISFNDDRILANLDLKIDIGEEDKDHLFREEIYIEIYKLSIFIQNNVSFIGAQFRPTLSSKDFEWG